MRVVIQRVSNATVTINKNEQRSIGLGLLVLVGYEDADDKGDVDWICNKIINLRIFNDEQGIMNKSVIDMNGNIMLISQFTLHASTKKGNRPSYIKASKPEIAVQLYEQTISTLESLIRKGIITGEFGADMQVELVNDGPVTILMDSKSRE